MAEEVVVDNRIPLWLDCDPGHDDAIAILLASFLPQFNLLGISTVHGNASLDNTTTNAISLLTAYERFDINVYPGAEKPLVRPLQVAPQIHGESGLDGTALLPSPAFPAQPDHSAVTAMAQAVESAPGQIAIVCTGTLTNMAVFIEKFPDLLPKIRYLSIMGGGVELGNWTPHAEFNIWCDALAAERVLTNQVLKSKTILVPLDVTHNVIATEEIQQQLLNGAHPGRRSLVRQMLYELMTFFADTYKQRFGFADGPPVHDPVALVALIPLYADILPHTSIPQLELEFSRHIIQVVQEGEKEGQTVLVAQAEDGVMVLNKINVGTFWQLVFEAADAMDVMTQAV